MDASHGQLHIFPRDRVQRRRTLCGTLTVVLRGIDCRPHFTQQAGQIAESHIVDHVFDGTAGGVPHHEHQFTADHRTRILHTAKNIFVRDVSCHARTEGVPHYLQEILKKNES